MKERAKSACRYANRGLSILLQGNRKGLTSLHDYMQKNCDKGEFFEF